MLVRARGTDGAGFYAFESGKKEVKLFRIRGKRTSYLLWYPLDWSPTCTNEHVCFVNDMKAFETLDAEVLGVSVDSAWSHKAFAEKMGIKYSLLADFHPRGAMSEKYGVVLGGQRHYGPGDRHRQQSGQGGVVQELRHSGCAGFERGCGRARQVKAATA